MRRRLDFAMIFTEAAIVAVLGLFAFTALDLLLGHTYEAEVSVVEKHYEPSHSTTGIAHGSGSGGNSGVGVVSSYEAEKYVLIISRDGRTQSREVQADVYANAQPGQTTCLKFTRGRFTGLDW